jgi:hypothetical protein
MYNIRTKLDCADHELNGILVYGTWGLVCR